MGSSQERIFEAVLKRMTEAPNVDWELVAEDAGYGSAANAKTMFNRFRKKLSEGTGSTASPEGGVKKTATPRKKTPAKKDSKDDGEFVTPTKTPSKRKRGSANATVTDDVTADDKEDADGSKTSRPRASKKPKAKAEGHGDQAEVGDDEQPAVPEEIVPRSLAI